MKLLTLNCHSWQEENQLEKIKYIAKIISENNYDVIAMQEVSQHINSEIVYENIRKDNFALLLIDELKKLGNDEYDFYFDIAHIGYDVYEEGLCLMTKLPIISRESCYVSKNEDLNFWKSRKIIKIKALYKDIEISFLSCHLGWFDDCEESFKYQADKLIENIEKDSLNFVMGDFNNNANVENEGYDYLSKTLIDTYKISKSKDKGTTVKGKIAGWDKNQEDLRLDIIFTNKEVEVLKSEVIFNGENKEIVSDHYGVSVDINI
ncbi:MAG: endonuclease/exonuclease/phosphatase family protein [Romboutsia sp.]|uniref:endonuclease/exonuclease/phosphatase family protein n=1 Tax=Romboutsia sp. TaxID=1965302 RepID=UPI003F398070